jgi:hypothetical protein
MTGWVQAWLLVVTVVVVAVVVVMVQVHRRLAVSLLVRWQWWPSHVNNDNGQTQASAAVEDVGTQQKIVISWQPAMLLTETWAWMPLDMHHW